MSLTGPIICPVCGKKAKTGSAIDCARHMFGTGDQPHRKWVEAQGLLWRPPSGGARVMCRSDLAP